MLPATQSSAPMDWIAILSTLVFIAAAMAFAFVGTKPYLRLLPRLFGTFLVFCTSIEFTGMFLEPWYNRTHPLSAPHATPPTIGMVLGWLVATAAWFAVNVLIQRLDNRRQARAPRSLP